MSIRRAVAADAERLAELHHDTVAVGYRDIFAPDSEAPSTQALAAGWHDLLVSNDAVVFLVETAIAAVGSVALVPDRTVPSGLLLKRLHVHPSRWGQGLGSELHDQALAAAIERGAERINLWVLEANRRARGMYERRGWVLQPGRVFPNDPPSIVDVLYGRNLTE